MRRWSREGRLQADVVDRKLLIDPDALDELRDAIFPTLPLPPEWRTLGDGAPAPNWVAGVALSQIGR